MMSSGKRFIWILAMTAYLVMTSGCASSHWRDIEEEIDRQGTGLHDESGQKVDGYHIWAQDPKKYKGWARVVDRDSLRIWPAVDSSDDLSQVFPLATVNSLKVVQASTGKTVLLSLGIAAIAAGVLFIAYWTSPMEFTANE